MKVLSTNQAAAKLGITSMTLSRYIKAGKVPQPQTVTTGGITVHLWTEEEVEQLRQLLPKIANGRKTRYQKQRSAPRDQQSVKAKKRKSQKKKDPAS